MPPKSTDDITDSAPRSTTKSGVKRSIPWFVAAGLLAITMVVAGIAVVFVMIGRIESDRVELTVGGKLCQPAEDWPAQPILFAREGVPIPARDLRSLIAVTDESGSPIQLTPNESMTINGTTGSFQSIASVDLRAIAPGSDVCVGVIADPGLQQGDLVVYPDFFATLGIGILGTMCLELVLFAAFAGATARGIVLAVKG